MKRICILVAASLALWSAAAQAAQDCPNDGTVRFGVEPFESAALLIPIYSKIGDLIAKKLGCKVLVQVTTNYTSEIEAMRAGKLDIAEFGPLGYVLAHQIAHAEAVAAYGGPDGKPDTYTAGIVTWPGSGITELKQVAGHAFAYSDPASTSGHLFPAYALSKAGIDPETGIKAFYAGNHTASFEAILNHKVQAGELNSNEIVRATIAGFYKPGEVVELWRSAPIPNDPLAVRATLPPAFKARVTKVLQTLDLNEVLTATQIKRLHVTSGRTVPQTDAAFDIIRDLVKILHLDLSKMAG